MEPPACWLQVAVTSGTKGFLMPTLVPGRLSWGRCWPPAGSHLASGFCFPVFLLTHGRVLLVGASVSQCGTVRQRVQAGLQAQASRSSAALGGGGGPLSAGLWGAGVWERKRQVSPCPGAAPGGGREAPNAWTVHFRAFINQVVGALGACRVGAVAGWPAAGSCFGRTWWLCGRLGRSYPIGTQSCGVS